MLPWLTKTFCWMRNNNIYASSHIAQSVMLLQHLKQQLQQQQQQIFPATSTQPQGTAVVARLEQ